MHIKNMILEHVLPLMESGIKIGKSEKLDSGTVASARKSKQFKWDRRTYDALVARFGKGAKDITSFEDLSLGKAEALTIKGGGYTTAKDYDIRLVGDYAEIINKGKSTYASITRPAASTKIGEFAGNEIIQTPDGKFKVYSPVSLIGQFKTLDLAKEYALKKPWKG